MNTQAFFATHPVFTVQEFDQFLGTDERTTVSNRKRLLSYHLSRGHLVRVRPALYAAVPLGSDPTTLPINTYLIAAHLTPDALLGYHAALALQGVAHTLREERIVISQHPLAQPLRFRGVTYRTVLPHQALVLAHRQEIGIVNEDQQGESVRVTRLERTLVDCLDRPRLGGGWEEIWRSYEPVPYLDLDFVADYALRLENATTIARVGYFLQQQQERWTVGKDILSTLRVRRPSQPHYLERRHAQPSRLLSEWNLIVPERIVDQSWEDRHESFA